MGDDREKTGKRRSDETTTTQNEKIKEQIRQLTNVSSTTSELILQALLAAQEKDIEETI
jgi:hypothetical protein